MAKEVQPCLTPDCSRPRLYGKKVCYNCFRADLKKKKEEKKLKKIERSRKTKKYQDKERDMLINKLDAVFSVIIRSLGMCLWPETEEDKHKGHLECSHIFSRRHMAIRWHRLNAKPLCTAHHFKWHKHPAEAAIFLSTIRTPEEIKWLNQQKNTIKQWTVPQLRELIEQLSQSAEFKDGKR